MALAPHAADDSAGAHGMGLELLFERSWILLIGLSVLPHVIFLPFASLTISAQCGLTRRASEGPISAVTITPATSRLFLGKRLHLADQPLRGLTTPDFRSALERTQMSVAVSIGILHIGCTNHVGISSPRRFPFQLVASTVFSSLQTRCRSPTFFFEHSNCCCIFGFRPRSSLNVADSS